MRYYDLQVFRTAVLRTHLIGEHAMQNNGHSLELENKWQSDERWDGIIRAYTAEDVIRLRGSIQVGHTYAELGAKRLWQLLQTEDYVAALGAMTGCQAVQQVQAGLQ